MSHHLPLSFLGKLLGKPRDIWGHLGTPGGPIVGSATMAQERLVGHHGRLVPPRELLGALSDHLGTHGAHLGSASGHMGPPRDILMALGVGATTTQALSQGRLASRWGRLGPSCELIRTPSGHLGAPWRASQDLLWALLGNLLTLSDTVSKHHKNIVAAPAICQRLSGCLEGR